MFQLNLENPEIEVSRHSNQDYSILTLHAELDGVKCSESIAVYSKFLFEELQDSERINVLDDIVSKLTYDLIVKSYKDIDKKVKKCCDYSVILEKMKIS